MDGIRGLAEGIAEEFRRLLPEQRKTQRNNLSLLVATMLDVRSANLMDLAAGLPRDADRIDMRYQWISRVLMNWGWRKERYPLHAMLTRHIGGLGA